MRNIKNDNRKPVKKNRIRTAVAGGFVCLLLSAGSSVPARASDPGDAYIRFALKLLSGAVQDTTKNVLISPLSAANGLGLLEIGTGSDTRKEVEDVLGTDIEQWCDEIALLNEQAENEEQVSILSSDSVWYQEDYGKMLLESYKEKAAETFGAKVQQLPAEGIKAINSWISDQTDGLISTVLDESRQPSDLYLINALSFNGNWEEVYREDQVKGGAVFSNADGSQSECVIMKGEVPEFIHMKQGEGFLKYYEGEKYAFAAILPSEGLTAADLAVQITPEEWHDALSGRTDRYQVIAAIPKFSVEQTFLLNDMAEQMELGCLFEQDADFSNMIEGADLTDLEAIHSTKLNVDESGTRAAAATVVSADLTASESSRKVKTIILDRPFLMAVVDVENELPLFIGAVNTLGG